MVKFSDSKLNLLAFICFLLCLRQNVASFDQERVIRLDNQTNDSTPKVKKDDFRVGNQRSEQETQRLITRELNMLSAASKTSVSAINPSQSVNLSSNQNQLNFVTSEATSAVWRSLGQISEDEKIEIIKRGFQLQNEGKISLKKYYESTGESTLFEWKGYSIKYESIRRTKLYQQLKV